MKRDRMRAGACLAAMLWAQMAPAQQAPTPNPASAPVAGSTNATKPVAGTVVAPGGQPVKTKDRRRAAKLYLEASKLYESGRFEDALEDYRLAAQRDPSNRDYALAIEVARSHAVTALIQSAAKARTLGDSAAARAQLQRARDLDPTDPQVAEHFNELANDLLKGAPQAIYQDTGDQLGGVPMLEPAPGLQSFHLKTNTRQAIEQVYKAYGIQTALDQSVSGAPTRFDLDNATYEQATHALSMVTNSFAVPLDAHRVVVARDNRANRIQFQREELETLFLPGLTPAELTEVSNIAKNVFDVPQVALEPSAGTITVRAPPKSLDAFNATLQDLLEGHSQVLLDVKIIQLAHTNERNIGVQIPQQVTAFNVYAEEQAILNANQALVQQIIASGLAAPGDTLAILGILLASGQVSSSIFTNGIALFGGGLTLSGLSPGPTTVHLNLNSSDSRQLDNVQLRLADGQDETLRSGSRYPILQASYSGLGTSGVNIPGLTTAGSSSGLSSLLSSLTGAGTTIPQVQYEDLGLTLKANPRVMRNGDVALTMDMKITALAGSTENGIPVLNNRSYSGVITLKEGHGAVLMSELDKQESQALSGTPGLGEIPGLNNINDKDAQRNYATLLVVITPRLLEGPHIAGHTPMMRIERGSQTR